MAQNSYPNTNPPEDGRSVILRQFTQSFQLQVEHQNFLRILYLETEKNLRIIDTVSFSTKGKHKTGDPAYMTTIKGLETDVVSMILMNPELHQGLFYEVQQFNPPVLVKDTEEEDGHADPFMRPGNILELCLALYLKIEASKKAADIDFVDGLQGIHFRTCLLNIRRMLECLSSCLKQTAPVMQMTWAGDRKV